MTRIILATKVEIKQTHGDRDFWQAVGAPLNWRLFGWNYRAVASFYDEYGQTVEVTAAHVRLLEAVRAKESTP